MIAEYIESLLPSTIPKVIGDLPATPEEIVGIMEYDSSINTEYFGPRLSSSIIGPIIKIVVRSKTYPQGQDWAEQIKNTLHRYQDSKLLSVLMVGNPSYLGRSAEKLHEFQVTFQTQVKE